MCILPIEAAAVTQCQAGQVDCFISAVAEQASTTMQKGCQHALERPRAPCTQEPLTSGIFPGTFTELAAVTKPGCAVHASSPG